MVSIIVIYNFVLNFFSQRNPRLWGAFPAHMSFVAEGKLTNEPTRFMGIEFDHD